MKTPNACCGCKCNVTAALLVLLLLPTVAAAEWKAGVARAKITPQQPVWMSGYAARDRPAEGTLHDLWAKALALDDGNGGRAVLVTLDLCGVDRDFSARVCKRLAERHKLDRSAIALNVSHTHTGPVVGSNLRPMYFLDERQGKAIDDYTAQLEEQVVAVASEAVTTLAPATVEWGRGTATFAVNRRTNVEADVPKLREEGKLKGPVDHDLPVLAVRHPETKALVAVVFGYACHATTLSFYQWSGDWPGFAQIELERKHIGATALFVAGCGADQNPLPRRTVQLAEDYGRQAAAGVNATIAAGLKPLAPRLRAAYSEVSLPFAALPTREQLEKDAASKDKHAASRAKFLAQQWDRDGGLPRTYPYPVQVWRLGDELSLVLLGGEVVVDYALRLKQGIGNTAWIAGYSNDVMAYIPSRRVLAEGGYEGGGAMVYYGLPSPWSPDVEDLIVNEVHRLADPAAGAGAQKLPVR